MGENPEITSKDYLSLSTVTPISPISGMKTGTGNFPQTSVSDTGKGSSSQDNTGKITKDTNVDKTDGKEKEVRYPNKLTPKQPANNQKSDFVR